MAYEVTPAGERTGKQVNMGTNWGSGIAISQDGTKMVGVSFRNRGETSSNFAQLKVVDVASGASSNVITGIRRTSLLDSPVSNLNYQVLNSASFAPDGQHVYVGGEGQSTVWKVNVSTGATTEVVPSGLFGTRVGWGGDFVKLYNGGTLGVNFYGELMYWPGEPSGAPRSVGFVTRGPGGGTFPRMQGLAVADGQVYLVDGGNGSNNQSYGIFKLPADFIANVGSYNSSSRHAGTLVRSNNDSSAGYWDLTSVQESLGCPPPPTMQVDKVNRGAPTGPDANGVYSATYTVTARNTGAAATTYQLFDKAQYGPNITVDSASWTGQRTGSATGAQIASAGHFVLAPAGTAIPANGSHTYTVTIRFRMSGGGYNPATCQPGNGLFNLAVVKDGATGSGYQDDDCMPPPAVGATFKIEKRPAPDQDPVTSGNQTTVVIAGNGSVTSYYDVVITNNSPRAGTPSKPIVDTLTPPPGFTVTGVTATIGATQVATSTGPSFQIAAAAIGEIPANGSKTIRVKVDWRATTAAMNAVADTPQNFVCESGTPKTTDNPKGLFNAVTLEGEDDPLKTENNQACVTPVVTPYSVSKSPRPGPVIKANPDGSATLTYEVTVKNESANQTAYTQAIQDEIKLPPYVAANGDATIQSTAGAGVIINGAANRWTRAQIVGGAKLPIASGVVLPGGATQKFTITIPVKVTANAQQWAELGTCTAAQGGGFTGGAQNGVLMDRDADGAGNNVACIPIVRDQLPSLTINKVGIDNVSTPLPGAQFTLYGSLPNGAIDMNRPIPSTTPGALNWKDLEVGTYHLVETKAPTGYQLLPKPIKFEISVANTCQAPGFVEGDSLVDQAA